MDTLNNVLNFIVVAVVVACVGVVFHHNNIDPVEFVQGITPVQWIVGVLGFTIVAFTVIELRNQWSSYLK